MLKIELDREDDGRWIADVPEIPGVMCYGESRQEAIDNVKLLCFRVIVDKLEHFEAVPELFTIHESTDTDVPRERVAATQFYHNGS